ncbi:hypothetical protein [Diatraea saccharalis granulovirus]|uniref:Uncharacterized protein n=1 Tax=Diatraea saccharalis granulovirus TaxID=1675862 RepID=A0A0R7EYZ9_9BBAC|nr:hypothetical protein [Diatraea saccharalis granulovirus]AKN80820.1 hypothetical protein [Diatraea saccharalis granulovirus]
MKFCRVYFLANINCSSVIPPSATAISNAILNETTDFFLIHFNIYTQKKGTKKNYNQNSAT